MVSQSDLHVDLIQELRLRRWARLNFVDRQQRDAGWHPVVLDEMTTMDFERGMLPVEDLFADAEVPLRRGSSKPSHRPAYLRLMMDDVIRETA